MRSCGIQNPIRSRWAVPVQKCVGRPQAGGPPAIDATRVPGCRGTRNEPRDGRMGAAAAAAPLRHPARLARRTGADTRRDREAKRERDRGRETAAVAARAAPAAGAGLGRQRAAWLCEWLGRGGSASTGSIALWWEEQRCRRRRRRRRRRVAAQPAAAAPASVPADGHSHCERAVAGGPTGRARHQPCQ